MARPPQEPTDFLAVNPMLIIADKAGSALDLSLQAQDFECPLHDDTRALMAAVPSANPGPKSIRDLQSKLQPSPIFPVGHRPRTRHSTPPARLAIWC